MGAQAAALHEMDHEGEVAEVQAQVLAPVAGAGELLAAAESGRGSKVLRAVGCRGAKAASSAPGEGPAQALGMGDDLGQFGHVTRVDAIR